MANWTLTFKDSAGQTCVVTIGGMNSAVTLIPANEPFSTQGDSSEDFFAPVRGESGYIRCICETGDMDELFSCKVLDHKVIFTQNGIFKWMGYVSQGAFSQPYQSGYVQLEIPVVGVCTAMDGVYTDEYLGAPLSIENIIRRWLTDMDIYNDFNQLMLTTRTPPEVLTNCIQFTELYPAKDGVCETSWGTIWQDICNLFGWQMQWDGDRLLLLSRDYDSGRVYVIDDLDLLADTTAGTAYPSVITIGNNVRDGHSVSIYPGKKILSVSGKVGKIEDNLFSFNLADQQPTAQGPLIQYDSGDYSRNKYYYAFTPKLELGNGSYQCYKSAYSGSDMNLPLFAGRVRDVLQGTSTYSNVYGADFEVFGYRDLLSDNTWQATNSNSVWTWTKGLVFVPYSSNLRLHTYFTFKSKTFTVQDEISFVTIGGIVKSLKNLTMENYDDPLESRETTIQCRIKFGNKYLKYDSVFKTTSWTSNIEERTYIPLGTDSSGNILAPMIKWFESHNPIITLPSTAFIFLPPGETGQFEIEIYGDNEYYLVFESLEFKLFKPEYRYGEIEDENTEESIVGEGNDQEYSITSNLTCARYGQFGPGCLYGPLTNNAYPNASTVDESGVWPEESYLERLKDYYSTSYKVFKLNTKNNVSMRDVVEEIDSANNTRYAVVSQSIDWRTRNNELTLIELK